MRGFVLIVACSTLLALMALGAAGVIGDGRVDYVDILAAILVGLPVAAIVSAAVLLVARRRPEADGLPQFRERGDVAVVLAFTSSIGAILGLSRIAGTDGRSFLPAEASLTLLVLALGACAAYPLRWLYLYLRGRLY